MNKLRCLLFLLMTLIVTPTSADEIKKVSLQLRWDSQFQFAGYYAAKWQGYYADAGLDVDIRSAITPDGNILGAVKEVADGNADFGIGAADILFGIDQGTPLVLLASIFQQSAAEFYAKEKTVLQSPADLLDLKVSRNVNDLIDVELQSMLLAEGINPNKIVPFKHMPGIQPLVDGSVDVIPGYRLSAPFEFEMQGMKVKTLRPISYGIDFYGDTLFTHARMIEQDAKIVERFRQASLKGWQYALEHSLEIADRITREVPRRTKLVGGDLQEFNRFQIQIVKDLAIYPIVEIGSLNPHRWQQMNALMRRIEIVKNEIDIDKISFNPEKIEQNNRNRALRFLMIAIYLSSGVIFLAVVFIILLKRQVSRATSKILQREVLLRESEEKHKRMIANISDVIAIMDGDGTILYKSPNIEKWFGWQPEDLVGTDGWQTVHPGDIERIQKEFFTLLDRDNSVATVEYRYKCKDGIYKLIELTAVNLTNDPLIRGVLMNYHDITDRKHTEDILSQMTERLNLALQASKAGAWDWDVVTGHIEWSAQMFDLFGLDPSRNTACFESWKSVLYPQDSEIAGNRIDQALKLRTTLDSDYRIVKPDGQICWINAVGKGKYDEQGRPIRMSGICMDITERKRAEETLRKAEQQLKFILDMVPAMIWQKDCEGKYLQVNEAFCQTVGLSYKNILGKTDYDLFPKEIADQYVNDDQRILNSGISKFNIEEQHLKPSGERGWSFTNKLVYNDDYVGGEHSNGTIGFAIDITERKRAEADLKAANTKLEMLWGIASMANADVKTISDHILASITLMSDSKYGFYGFVNADESVMTIHAWSGDAMKDCSMVDKPQQFPVCKAGVWAEAIRRREPLILNDYSAAFIGKIGLPEGHVSLTNLLVVPFFYKGKITAVAAVANRIADYGMEDVSQITAFLGSVQAIVERRHTEEALRESEKCYRLLFQNLTTGFAMHEIILNEHGDPCDYRFLEANPAFEKLTGLKAEQITGKTVLQVLPNTEPYWIETFGKVASTGEPINFENFSKELDKHYIVTAYSPEPGKFATIFLDITDRKKAEDALQESIQRLNFHIDNSPMATVEWDADFVVTRWAGEAERIFGWNQTETIGSPIMDLHMIYEEDIPIVQKTMAQLIDGSSKSVISANRNYTKDGRIMYCEWYNSVLLDSQGNIISILSQVLDITKRKKAEDALAESEQYLRTILQTAVDGFWLVDCKGKLIETNDSYCRMSGYMRDEFLNLDISAIEAVETPVETKARIQRIIKNGSEIFETRHKRKDGSIFDVEISTTYLKTHGIIVCFCRDISARKRSEEEKAKLEARLLQAHKMESIGSLAGGIAHDLNNILFPISGLSEMLLDELPASNPEYESIEQIHKSAQRGSDLVKQILAFSRQSSPQKLPIRMQPILKEVLKLARATIPMNIEITSHIKPDCGMVLADPTQVHQISMNLITNAYHAVEGKGGTINIELKETVFENSDSLKPGKYACVSISDNGIGIDQSLIDKIFDPYFTTKELGKGTGLGLSVVHGIVKEHGGDILIYSEVGKGTVFHVYLPLLEDTTDIKTTAITRKYPTGCESILLVDDEEPIIRMGQMMLEKLGYKVTTRTSSPDALAAFKANPDHFDLVISDRGMPNMTGEQLARELISIRPDIPIILCTGFSDENDEKCAREIGVKGFLKKPVATGDLSEMVRKVLDEIADGM